MSTLQINPGQNPLGKQRYNWLLTGVAGFIGSNLLQALLELDQSVIGVDNFATGHQHNLESVKSALSSEQWSRFNLQQLDVTDSERVRKLVAEVDIVLHQAALGSVPRSIENPARTLATNVGGMISILEGVRQHNRPLVFASSSSVYGSATQLPQQEAITGEPLSPYAASKQVGESLACSYARTYGIKVIGLRYFNVFGPRQDPNGAYAAVIPLWIKSILDGRPCKVFGDGSSSRDFCYIDNVVEANLLAASSVLRPGQQEQSPYSVYNVALQRSNTLSYLLELISKEIAAQTRVDRKGERGSAKELRALPPVYASSRAGDLAHSRADISRIKGELGYQARVTLEEGIRRTVHYFLQQAGLKEDGGL